MALRILGLFLIIIGSFLIYFIKKSQANKKDLLPIDEYHYVRRMKSTILLILLGLIFLFVK